MKRILTKLFLLGSIAICSYTLLADFDYIISDTYCNSTLTLNNESVQVLGEGVNGITANGASYVEVVNTTPYVGLGLSGIGGLLLFDTSAGTITGGHIYTAQVGDNSMMNIQGGIINTDITAYGNSVTNMSGGVTGNIFSSDSASINISGGEIKYGIWLRHDVTATLSGGSIGAITSNQSSGTVKHITFICDVDSVNYTGSLLTGNWLDGSSFSINLRDQSGYDSVYSNINFIPEPATLALLGLGGLLLRRRK